MAVHCCQYQNNAYQKKLAEQIVGKMVPTASSSIAPVAEISVNPSTRKKRARLPPPIEKPVPANNVPPIIETFDQLKSLGFRIALALLFLPKDTIQKKVDESGNLAALIKKSNTTLLGSKSPNEIFQDLIYTEIDNSNLNYFQKKGRKTICWLLAPSVLFLVEHFLEQSQDVVLYLIGLTPEQRLDLFVKMCIEPGHGFIGWLQSKYKTISETENPGATVGQAIGSAIDHIKLKDRHGKDLTSKDLISRLVSSLFDQFAPSLNWSKTGAAHFEQRGQDSKSPFFSLWFISLSYVSRAVNILTTPWRWCLNGITRKILKEIAVSQIHSIISDKDGASLDFGKLALNSIYKALHDKLQKINRSTKAAETENSRRANALHQRGFVEKSVQDSINKLISDFLELLDIQGLNVHKLQAKLSPANLFEQGKKEVIEAAYARGIQKATEEIIHGLQIFLEDHTFSAALLEVLQDIHKQWLCFNTGDTDTSLARLENDFYVELKDAVTNGIQTVITNKSDPLKHIQKEANLFIDGLDVDAQTFKTCFDSLQNFTPTSLKTLKQMRDIYLTDNFRRRREKANKETNHSTQLQITYTSDQFEALSKPICTKIDELVDFANKKKQIDELNEDLGQLLPPLESAITPQPLNSATARYGPLQKILQRIVTRNYPESVQLLISKLQGNFEAWRTEAQKRDNQTLINGTITTLKSTIETAIKENTQKTNELSEKITKKAKSAVKLTNALVGWTGKLNYFDCKSDKVEIDPFSPAINYLAKEKLPRLILGKIDDFVLFLGKNHHIKGILSFVIKAYLELPRSPPKEFKKIVYEVRQRPSSRGRLH
ncbi:MAG TPA: hypothetical protein VFU89_07560 [Rhabdochlamydiaceae bacterium]|nr:hypothetical protein [Rhabdochlamydiaceae bacterium]